MKTLVFGVWHPAAALYGREYFASLRTQSDCAFDLLIITDQCELPDALGADAIVQPAAAGSTPAEIRLQGIRFAREHGYDALVFSDCDDFFAPDRVRNVKTGLASHEIVVNNLTLVDATGCVTAEKIYDGVGLMTAGVRELLRGNFFGLSNMAVRVGAIPPDFLIPRDAIAVDWWIASVLLLEGARFVFENETVTYYRQHSANTVGEGRRLSVSRLIRGIDVKSRHYRHLLAYCRKKGWDGHAAEVETLSRAMEELAQRIGDERFRARYIGLINEKYEEIHRGWWSEILPLDEWNIYA